MINPIAGPPIQSLAVPSVLEPKEPKPAGVDPFVELLQQQVTEVNGLQQDSEQMVHQLLTGEDVNSVEVFTAVQKADMAFRMMQQIRNKLVDAYREINQMQI